MSDDRGERGGTAVIVWRAGRGGQPPSRPPALFQVGRGALMLLLGRTGPTVDGSKFGAGVDIDDIDGFQPRLSRLHTEIAVALL